MKDLEDYDFPAWSGTNQLVGSIYQVPLELATLSHWVGCLDIKTYLEIGVASGGLMHYFVNVLGVKAFGIDIIMPPVVVGDIHIGTSHSPESVKWAKENAPYDMIFLDGDHSYEAIKGDWELYGGMATKIVVFHDVGNGNLLGPRRVWDSIKERRLAIIVPGENRGIGIVFVEKEK